MWYYTAGAGRGEGVPRQDDFTVSRIEFNLKNQYDIQIMHLNKYYY